MNRIVFLVGLIVFSCQRGLNDYLVDNDATDRTVTRNRGIQRARSIGQKIDRSISKRPTKTNRNIAAQIKKDEQYLAKEQRKLESIERAKKKIKEQITIDRKVDKDGVKKMLEKKNQLKNVCFEQNQIVKKLDKLSRLKKSSGAKRRLAGKLVLVLIRLSLYKNLVGKDVVTQQEMVNYVNMGGLNTQLAKYYEELIDKAENNQINTEEVQKVDGRIKKILVKIAVMLKNQQLD